MMQKIVVNQSYETSENEIKSIVNNFESINDYIAKGTRNSIKKKTLENGKIATIKSFKIPNIVNKYVYRFFRKSKAERSYQYAKKLIDLGIDTTFTLYEGMGHAYIDHIGNYPQAEDCVTDISDFVKKNRR